VRVEGIVSMTLRIKDKAVHLNCIRGRQILTRRARYGSDTIKEPRTK